MLLFLFLGDIRASLIVASVIPLSMLAAFIGMNWMGVSGNLMSLGAIDFGLIVDGSVVMIENIFHRFAEELQWAVRWLHRVFEAGREVLRPIVFAIGIIIVVYLPILTLPGSRRQNVPPDGVDGDLRAGRLANLCADATCR